MITNLNESINTKNIHSENINMYHHTVDEMQKQLSDLYQIVKELKEDLINSEKSRVSLLKYFYIVM